MERPDDIMFSGAKIGKDVPAPERRARGRAKRATTAARRNLQDKPSRPGAPPERTDSQRRENRTAVRPSSRPTATVSTASQEPEERRPRRRRLRPKPSRNG